jgi:hypothetical protein
MAMMSAIDVRPSMERRSSSKKRVDFEHLKAQLRQLPTAAD